MRGFSALTLAQITSLTKKIEERNKQAAKIEKSIKVANVSTPMPRDDSISLTCYFAPIRITGILPYRISSHP
jgi:hypothetical protein